MSYMQILVLADWRRSVPSMGSGQWMISGGFSRSARAAISPPFLAGQFWTNICRSPCQLSSVDCLLDFAEHGLDVPQCGFWPVPSNRIKARQMRGAHSPGYAVGGHSFPRLQVRAGLPGKKRIPIRDQRGKRASEFASLTAAGR